jgi:hypothetical protein
MTNQHLNCRTDIYLSSQASVPNLMQKTTNFLAPS